MKATRRRKSRRQRNLPARTYELPKALSRSRNRRAGQAHQGLTAQELDWDSLVLQHLASRNDGIATLSNVGSSALVVEQFLDRKTVLVGAQLWNMRNAPDFLPQEALIDDEHRAYAEGSVANVANWIISGGDSLNEEYEYLQNAFVDVDLSVRNLTIANYHLSDSHHHNRQLKSHLVTLETLVLGIESHAVRGGGGSARRYAGEVLDILSVQPHLKRLTLVQATPAGISEDDGAYIQPRAATWYKNLACLIGLKHSKLDTPKVDIFVLVEEQREEEPVRVVTTHPFQIWPLLLKGGE
ncbi:uncharacterized protein N0V89_011809 [Didymosphaeria variabile]|uniref:Uncharacterized protein n=1 Tax=Didymosphaeria variabile TaxID=1932322 RepID=A0A9W8XAM7_9PLEO|nr:uncharacterized protein N0V89_011809 [Didymosphaeria variabile]KAJ4345674.1 hypothetical protein N0V89_011809 [Didymosphaeria variabile]